MDITSKAPSQPIIEPSRDSRRWNDVKPRPTDIIIATCYKAGTTLTQQIVNLLLNGDRDFDAMRYLSPWVESPRIGPSADYIEALPSPRFLKTHLHPQALPWYKEWKYLYLARDGRDVGLSLYNHICAMKEELEALGNADSHDFGCAEFSDFWDEWVETGKPDWDFWENIASWWEMRRQPNVLLIHYNDLVYNKPVEAQRIADFLGCNWNTTICDLICEKSSLEYMRQLELEGKFGVIKKNKKKTFMVNKGSNGRWQNLLTEQQLRRYEEIVTQKLEPACAQWLRHGGSIDN